MKKEAWKLIPDYEGQYSASDLGRILSHERLVDNGRGTYLIKDRILSNSVDSRGYESVLLCNNGHVKKFGVAVLVLSAFVSSRPIGYECCHNNGNKLDNRLENLRWGTRQDNGDDMVEHGSVRGESNPRSILSEEDVLLIRKSIETGPKLAKKFGVSRSAIYNIRSGTTWSHVV